MRGFGNSAALVVLLTLQVGCGQTDVFVSVEGVFRGAEPAEIPWGSCAALPPPLSSGVRRSVVVEPDTKLGIERVATWEGVTITVGVEGAVPNEIGASLREGFIGRDELVRGETLNVSATQDNARVDVVVTSVDACD